MDENSDVIKIKVPSFKMPKDITSHLRQNPWMVSTFVLAILVLVLLAGNVFEFSGNSANKVSADDAGNKIVTFLNENSPSEVILEDVSLRNGLYKVNVDYQGNTIPIYVTTDGNYFIQDIIPISSDSSNSDIRGSTPVQISEDDDAALGDEKADVTIIEFSDYQCPFCRKFWVETLPQLKTEYIDTGKVKLVYRDFPLTSLHPMAQPAAEAAECVREKGGDTAFFKYHDKLFGEQNILDGGDRNNGPVRSTAQFTNNDLKKWASELGYNIDSCLDSGKYKSEVEKDLADGQQAGVSGTPSFFINGQPISGAQPFSVFEKIIEGELSA